MKTRAGRQLPSEEPDKKGRKAKRPAPTTIIQVDGSTTTDNDSGTIASDDDQSSGGEGNSNALQTTNPDSPAESEPEHKPLSAGLEFEISLQPSPDVAAFLTKLYK
jgi:hypothetical protein